VNHGIEEVSPKYQLFISTRQRAIHNSTTEAEEDATYIKDPSMCTAAMQVGREVDVAGLSSILVGFWGDQDCVRFSGWMAFVTRITYLMQGNAATGMRRKAQKSNRE